MLPKCGLKRLDVDNDGSAFVYTNLVIVPRASGGIARWQRGVFSRPGATSAGWSFRRTGC
jgi:hypothetical protein